MKKTNKRPARPNTDIVVAVTPGTLRALKRIFARITGPTANHADFVLALAVAYWPTLQAQATVALRYGQAEKLTWNQVKQILDARCRRAKAGVPFGIGVRDTPPQSHLAPARFPRPAGVSAVASRLTNERSAGRVGVMRRKLPPQIEGRVLDSNSPESKAILAQFDLETMELKPIAELRRKLREGRGLKSPQSAPQSPA